MSTWSSISSWMDAPTLLINHTCHKGHLHKVKKMHILDQWNYIKSPSSSFLQTTYLGCAFVSIYLWLVYTKHKHIKTKFNKTWLSHFHHSQEDFFKIMRYNLLEQSWVVSKLFMQTIIRYNTIYMTTFFKTCSLFPWFIWKAQISPFCLYDKNS